MSLPPQEYPVRVVSLFDMGGLDTHGREEPGETAPEGGNAHYTNTVYIYTHEMIIIYKHEVCMEKSL